MKNLSYLFTFLLLIDTSLAASAQAPYGFNYQAVARDNAGRLMTNQNLNVRIVVLSGASASKKIYEESHTVTTNDYGHFNLTVGQGSTSDDFSNIKWSAEPHHLKVEIDPGSGFVVMGTVQLQSVPYALHSKTAESVETIDAALGDLSDVDVTTTEKGQVLKYDGTKWVADKDQEGNHPNIVQYIGGVGITMIDDTVVTAKTDDALWNAKKIQGKDISTVTPNEGEALVWDGSVWKPQVVNDQLKVGTGLTMNGSSLEADYGTALWNANKLNNINIQTGLPSNNDILQYDGSRWSYKQLPTSSGGSNWTKSGNNIYYTNGNVGIGDDDPALKFVVFDSITSTASGYFYMTQEYMHAGTSSNAAYTGSRNVVFGHGGFSNVATLNLAGGDASTRGEGIASVNEAAVDGGTYNIGSLNKVFTGATGISAGTYSLVKAQSTSNIAGYFTSSRANTNTNYGIFASADSASTNYAGYFAGDVTYTGSLSGPSDAKLKTNVNALSNGLDIVMKLDAKTYDYLQTGEAGKLNLPEGKQYGFIAQELEEVIPELVKEQAQPLGYKEYGEPIEYKAVNYISLIPILTEAIQEQQAYIKALEARIKKLEEGAK